MSHKNRTSRVPLSPGQYSIVTVARLGLVLETWELCKGEPCEVERAMLFDYVCQQPRTVLGLVPELQLVLDAYDILESDVSELFAKRSMIALYERFQEALAASLGRNLIAVRATDDGQVLQLTELGRSKAFEMTSSFSSAVREIVSVLCEKWGTANATTLGHRIMAGLPDQSLLSAQLADPFGVWLDE